MDDSDPFEEWRRITQEQLHVQMLDTLTQLAIAAEADGDSEGALQATRRQLTLEPWLEAAHRQVIRLLAQQGQSAAAIAQYNLCRQLLAEELGVEPEDETTALFEQIRTGKFGKGIKTQGDGVNRFSDFDKLCHRISQPALSLLPTQPVSPSPLRDWVKCLRLTSCRAGGGGEQLTAWLTPPQ